MARKPKVTDEEILQCLSDGMRQNEIAERYGLHPTAISQRVRAMKKSGKLPSSGGENPKVSSTPPPKMENVLCLTSWIRLSGKRTVNGSVL